MSLLSCLSKEKVPLVADTSVVINLNATLIAPEILQLLANPLLITENAFAEIENGIRNGHNNVQNLHKLLDSGLLRKVSLGTLGTRVYESLIDGETIHTLDDGEAATIGYAYEGKTIAMIDERKAIGLCTTRLPDIRVVSTVDLLLGDSIVESLGEDRIKEAVFNALTVARMRVPSQHLTRVVKLIGQERAAKCASLPRAVREPKVLV